MAFLPRNSPRALLGTACAFPVRGPRDYAVNRYRREAERHRRVLDSQLTGRNYVVGSDYTIVDMSALGLIDYASRVMKGAYDPLAPFPNVKRRFTAIDGRPAVARARGRKWVCSECGAVHDRNGNAAVPSLFVR